MTETPPLTSRPHILSAFAGVARFLRPYSWLLVAATLSMLLTVAITLALPLVARGLIERFDTPAPNLPYQPFLAAAGIALCAAVVYSVRFYLTKLIGELAIADIRRAIFARMITMGPAFYERIMTGEVVSRITSDTTLLLNMIGWSFLAALRHALVLVGALGMLATTSFKLTLFVLAVVPVVIVPIYVLGSRLREQSRLSQELIANSTGSASESLSAAQTVQAFTNEGPRTALFDSLADKAFDAARRVARAHVGMNGSVVFLTLAGVVSVIWVGATDMRNGTLESGVLVQFILYAMLLAEAANGLTNAWGDIQRAAAAAERINDLLDAEDTVADPCQPKSPDPEAAGTVSFEAVTFRYPTRPNQPALDNVKLHIQAGETVALVGPSGAGKSTVLQLLLRFYDPDRGRILLDGIDLRDMSRSAFRRRIAFVPQDPKIFALSAVDNIRFGTPGATTEEVEAAARAAAAHSFLSAMPDGYDTILGERGVMLSGGQKQRIAIARAILRKAPILLLDEATSALDVASETAVKTAIEQMSQNRTTIVIAHRLATVTQADRIVVFDQGRIVATGRHDDLLQQGGLYAEFAKLQFGAQA